MAYWFIRWQDDDESFGVLGVTSTREAAVSLVADAIEEFAHPDSLPNFDGEIPPRDNENLEEWLSVAEQAIENATVEYYVHPYTVG